MIFDVYFRDGSVGQIEAANKTEAKRIARDFSDEPIDEIEEVDEADLEEEGEDDGDPDSFEDDEEEDD